MFPLFNLPKLALGEVFRTMETRELVLATFLSERTKLAIKSTLPKNRLEITFRVSNILTVDFGFFIIYTVPPPNEKNQGALFKIGKRLFQLFLRKGPECWISPHSDDRKSFEISLIAHFVEVFNNPVVSLTCKNGISENYVSDRMKYFEHKKLKIKHIGLKNIKLSAQKYTEILNACTDINRLEIDCQLPLNFYYKPLTPFTTKKVSLYNSCSWMNLEDFIKCESLLVYNSNWLVPQFSSKSINLILKKVQSGESNLKFMNVPMKGSFLEAVNGLIGSYSPGEVFNMDARNGNKFRISCRRGILMQRIEHD